MWHLCLSTQKAACTEQQVDDQDYPASFDGLLQLVERLRGPQGCPWDRQQTRDSLKPQFLEECYELLEAMDQGDASRLLEELGDVLLHVAFQLQLARERGEFTGADVFRQLIAKLVRRHPHVFGDVQVASAEEVVSNWQAIKGQEQAGTEASILDGVPRQMPALAYAQAVQERAARVGFDWEDFQGVLAKVVEELREVEAASPGAEREKELGDLLFSLVNASRWLGVDAEGALRQADARFYRRFVAMERLCRQRGLSFKDLPMQEKEALWQEAKRLEGATGTSTAP